MLPDAGPSADAGGVCANGEADSLPIEVTFRELYQTFGCSFFSSPVDAGLAFTLGGAGVLRRRGAGELELGASSFVWSDGAFRRSLECGDIEQPWRFSESLHGTWSDGDPVSGCAGERTRFSGSYHYEECIALPDGGCGSLPGSCSQFAVVEITLGPASTSAPESALPVAASVECRPIRPRCAEASCAGEGQTCQVSNECELGLVCAGDGCDGPGTCQAIRECPPEAEPVCSCSGFDYPSACAARASAQRVAHAGPCLSDVSGPPILIAPGVDVDREVDAGAAPLLVE
jgi:hypothetical protein